MMSGRPPAPSHRTNFDVIVVGGGAVGGAVVAELSKHKIDVGWIVDEPHKTDSATRAAGAMLGAFGEVGTDSESELERVELDFRLQSQRMYRDWLPWLKEHSGQEIFVSQGTFVVGNNAGTTDRAVLKNIMAATERFGEAAELVEPTDVPGLNPTDRYAPIGCIYLRDEHAVSSSDLLGAIRSVATRDKGTVLINETIHEVSPNKDTWIVDGTQHRYEAGSLVICAGSQSHALLPASVRDICTLPSLYFGKGSSATLTQAPSFTNTIRTPNRAFACGVHVVPRSNEEVYLGATNFFGTDHQHEAGVEVGELHILFDQAIHQISTDLRLAKISDTRFGFRPITTSRRPIIGQTALPNLFIGTGTYRNGVLMAPLIAKHIVADITQANTELPNPYRPVNSPIECKEVRLERLIEDGVKDIVGILHEPNGTLPYNRSKELEKLLATLFRLAIIEEPENPVREEIRAKLQSIPLNETMNRIFYDLVDTQ